MAVVIEGKNSFFLADRAQLLPTDRDLAWAEKYVKPNEALKYVLGRYVEADRANHNKQYWSLNDLLLAQPTIQWAPMNLLHQPRTAVGTFIASEMLYPIDSAAKGDMNPHEYKDSGDGTCATCGMTKAQHDKKMAEMAFEYDNPYIEALGVFWEYYFPQEYKLVETAHASGSLYFSMECVSKTLTCDGEHGCQQEFAYAGPRSETYCEHLNNGVSIKRMNEPHFLAGALVIPPAKPGWDGADIRSLSALVAEHQVEAEMAYEGIREISPDADAHQWEYAMAMLMKQAWDTPDIARQFDAETRQKMANKGQAMPDGSFPIANEQDLRNAIQAIGRAKNPEAAKRHIRSRAKALGLENLLPDTWK